jgi:hypothetical protein
MLFQKARSKCTKTPNKDVFLFYYTTEHHADVKKAPIHNGRALCSVKAVSLTFCEEEVSSQQTIHGHRAYPFQGC